MPLVEYVGQKKKGMPIDFPIGTKSKSSIELTKILKPGESLEMSDADVKALLAISSHFTIVGEAPAKRGRPKKEVEAVIA